MVIKRIHEVVGTDGKIDNDINHGIHGCNLMAQNAECCHVVMLHARGSGFSNFRQSNCGRRDRDDTKEALYKMMDDEFKGVQYALFPKTIKYKRSKDGAKMTTHVITLQVTETPGITVADF
jgi:hypothetical protein